MILKSINVGIIGLGFIGAHHIDAVRRIPGAYIKAISDQDRNILEAATTGFCIGKGYTDWHDLVADPQIDVIHNCTPDFLHDEVNRTAIHAGKHIYAEKPLSLTAASAKELWQLAIEQKVAHAVNHQYRLNAAVQEMRARILNGDCGRPLFVRGHYLQEVLAQKTDYSKRRVPETGPARAIADIGSHWADTACCVMGKRITAVMADMITHHPLRVDPETGQEIPIRSDDTTSVLLRFEDGTPGMLMASKITCGHKNDLVVTVNGELCEITWQQQLPDRLSIGRREQENGEYFVNKNCAHVEAQPFISTPVGHVMGWPDAFRNAVLAFYTSIWENTYLQGKQPYATFEDGWRTNLFIDACIISSREKRWVELEGES